MTAAAINLASSALAMSFSRFVLWAWVPKLDDAPGRNLEVGSGRALQGIHLDAPVGGDGLVRIV